MDTVVGTILGGAIAAPFLYYFMNRWAGVLLAMLPLAATIYFANWLPQVAAGAVVETRLEWVPSLGITASFRLDGLSLLMALLVCGIGTLVLLYASSYLAGHEQIGRFYALILLFMGAMLGLVLADNLLLLFVFWELTSISSYLLIGFKHEQETARQSALQALLVTGAGGLALMAGLILLAHIGGSWEISELFAQAEVIQREAAYGLVLLLVLLGAFTKSAQFPFHFWLPNAMAAPTPVSAYLHSATMVKAGIYLLARLFPVLGGTAAWTVTLVSVGGVTAVIGAWLSWQKSDLKQILAYSTISALGILVLLLGLGTELALKTAVLFLVAHALYKGALFLAAGTIEHESATRNITELGGLARKMPLTLVGVMIAALSMAGLPPLLGFLSKEYLYETTLYLPGAGWWIAAVLTAAMLLTNIFLVLTSVVLIMKPFFGQPSAASEQAHEAPLAMWLGPIVLGAFTLLLGSVPNLAAASVLAPAASAVAGRSIPVSLSLWHGFTPMLALSLVTVTVGVLGYLAYGWLWPKAVGLDTAVARIGPARGYNIGLDGLLRLALAQTKLVQNGYLHHYMRLVLGALLILVGGTLFFKGAFDWPSTITMPRIHEVGLAGVTVAATIMSITARSRLAAIAALGVIGYSIAMFYVLFSAPDLAMTQLSVETLTVILFVLVLYRLPYFNQLTDKLTRQRDALIALTAGGLMTTLVLIVLAVPTDLRLTPFFAESSWLLAKGRNVVNVILVDFRGSDTMGEITVLAVAAIGVFALLQSARKGEAAGTYMERIPRMTSSILTTAIRYLLPLLLLFSIFVLLRGHNEPGGGFVGGLIAAAAFSLYAIAEGVDAARHLLRIEPRTLIAVGLATAVASALVAPFVFGEPFMTGLWGDVTLPIIGKPGTPFFFDIGVFQVVVGVTLLIVFSLAEN